MHSRIGNLVWDDCRKLVSPPLSPPAHPWPPAGRGIVMAARGRAYTPASWPPYPSAPKGAPHTAKPYPWRPRPHFAAAAPSMATA